MLFRVVLVRTDVSEEPGASFIRVTKIGELGTASAVTNTLMMDALSSFKTSRHSSGHLIVAGQHLIRASVEHCVDMKCNNFSEMESINCNYLKRRCSGKCLDPSRMDSLTRDCMVYMLLSSIMKIIKSRRLPVLVCVYSSDGKEKCIQKSIGEIF
jgi:hypothetical protein